MEETPYSTTEIALQIAVATALEHLDDSSICALRNDLRKYSDALNQGGDTSFESWNGAGTN